MAKCVGFGLVGFFLLLLLLSVFVLFFSLD